MANCPIECVSAIKEVACPSPDFLEKNGSWLLTVIGLGIGCVGTVLTYFLRSRCKEIKCWGVQCTRDVVALEPSEIEIVSNTK